MQRFLFLSDHGEILLGQRLAVVETFAAVNVQGFGESSGRYGGFDTKRVDQASTVAFIEFHSTFDDSLPPRIVFGQDGRHCLSMKYLKVRRAQCIWRECEIGGVLASGLSTASNVHRLYRKPRL